MLHLHARAHVRVICPNMVYQVYDCMFEANLDCMVKFGCKCFSMCKLSQNRATLGEVSSFGLHGHDK